MAARITRFARRCVIGALHLLLLMKPLVPSAAATAVLACSVIGGASAVAAENPRRSYDIARGDAAVTLKLFADASDRQVVYLVDTVRGVVTNPVKGTFTAREVLALMLRHTALIAVEDAKTGALLIQRAPPPSTAPADPSSSAPRPNQDPMKPTRQKSAFALLPALLALLNPSTLPGQVAPAVPANDKEADPVKLSPFTVSATEDKGYRASSSLSGTRIKTDLRDLAGSISVVTKDLMQDIGASDAKDILVYTVGTETSGAGGNFSNATPGGAYADSSRALSDPLGSNRVRGLTAADYTRNFNTTAIPFDSYNTQRVDINRGSNSILFGLGSPAGIINSQSIEPTFRRKARVDLETGSFGSTRLTLDVDQPVIPNKLAFRFALLDRRTDYEQKPAFEDDRRQFFTLVARPFAQTTFRASYERGEIDANRPRLDAPLDTLTRWWDFGKPTHDPANRSFTTINRDLVRAPGEWFTQIGVVYDNPASSTPSNAFDGQNVITRNGAPFLAHMVSISQFVQYAVSPSFNRPDGSFYSNPQLLDRSIFDYRKVLIDGPNKAEWQDFQTLNLTLEQTFDYKFGRGGLELAFAREQDDRYGFNTLPYVRGYNIHIDINTTLPYGPANPNFGRAFLAQTPESFQFTNDREVKRATAFAEFDSGKHWRGFGRWLGKHTLTGMYSEYENATRFLFAQGSNEFGQNAVLVHYLGDSLAARSAPGGARLPGLTALHSLPASVTSPKWDTVGQNFVSRTTRVIDPRGNRDAAVRVGSKNLDTLRASAWVLQSRLLDDSLITTLGWRQDDSSRFNDTGMPRTPGTVLGLPNDPSWRLSDRPSLVVEGEIFSYGAVAHLPAAIRRRLPLGLTASLHYNESENFQPSNLRTNIFGRSIAPPGGQTRDYGFSFAALNDKIQGRVTWYETTSSGANSGQAASWFIRTDALIVQYNTPAARAAAGYVEPPQFIKDLSGWREVTLGNGQVVVQLGNLGFITDTTDLVSKGVEAEMVYNPTDNWRISFNAAKQEAARSNTAPAFQAYYDLRRSMWQEGPANVLIADESGQVVRIRSRETFINEFEARRQLDGGIVSELRKWRWNVITNYNFSRDTFLRGWHLGGAARWQDKVGIGFPIKTASGGQRIQDVSRPYFGPTDFKLDGWVGYQRPIFNRKITWKLQLNVRNLLDEKELIPVRAQPDGSIAAYYIPTPITWNLRSTFEF